MRSAAARNRLLIVSSHFPPDRSAGTHRVLRLANYLQMHGWATSVLTLDPAFYRHSIQLDDALVGRADPRLTIFRTGACRGLTAMIRWRNQLLRRGVPNAATHELTGWLGRRGVGTQRLASSAFQMRRSVGSDMQWRADFAQSSGTGLIWYFHPRRRSPAI